MKSIFLVVIGLLFGVAQADEKKEEKKKEVTSISSSKSGNWGDKEPTLEGLLVDSASASVAASALAGVGGDAVKNVSNVKDFAILVQAFGNSEATLGFSFTPARSQIPSLAMGLETYATRPELRPLAALTFSYAQGKSALEGKNFNRKAYSLETSWILERKYDPILAVYDAQCATLAAEKLPAPSQSDVLPSDGVPTGNGPLAMGKGTDELLKIAKTEFTACSAKALKVVSEQWNRSQLSISFSSGRIKNSDGIGNELSLGQTFAIAGTWGIDQLPSPGSKLALTTMFRHSKNEPVLKSLITPNPKNLNNSLAAIRIAGGSSVFRGLVEFSNAKTADITTSQSVFKRAVGVDIRVQDGIWLGLRSGKQQKTSGAGTETATFFALNYSPQAILGH